MEQSEIILLMMMGEIVILIAGAFACFLKASSCRDESGSWSATGMVLLGMAIGVFTCTPLIGL